MLSTPNTDAQRASHCADESFATRQPAMQHDVLLATKLVLGSCRTHHYMCHVPCKVRVAASPAWRG